MKIFARISLVLFLVLPLITFYLGYFLGNRDIEVVVAYQDPVSTNLPSTNFIGSVSGTASARFISSPKPRINVVVQNEVKQRIKTSSGVWEEINSYRQSQGLAAFGQDDALCAFAQTRIEDLKSIGSLDGHSGFNSRVREYLESRDFQKLAENMAQGYDSGVAVVEGWKGSAGHHATLLASDLNVGCVRLEGNFAVLIAGRR